MAAAPSSWSVPTTTKDQKESESNKQRTQCSEGFCNEWNGKSKGHAWVPLPHLPLACDGLVSLSQAFDAVNINQSLQTEQTTPRPNFEWLSCRHAAALYGQIHASNKIGPPGRQKQNGSHVVVELSSAA